MSKTGRNDPCPCASGKKYKHCHLDNVEGINSPGSMSAEDQIENFFKSHSRKELVRTISGLSVLPGNLGKNKRLDYCCICSLETSRTHGRLLTDNEMSAFLDQYFKKDFFEEYPENIFTNLLVAFNKNFIVFSGPSLRAPFWLKNLLLFVFSHSSFDEENFDAFKRDIFGSTRLLLALSNEVAVRLNYQHNLPGDFEDEKIITPNKKKLDGLKSAVTFTKEQMSELAVSHLISAKYILDYICTDVEISSVYNPNDNILIDKPIYFDKEYILLSPHNLCLTATRSIIKAAQKHGILPPLILTYHEITFSNTIWYLTKMDFVYIENPVPLDDELPVREVLLKFDTDKFAYILYAFDDYRNFSNTGFEMPDNDQGQLSESIMARRDKILEEIELVETFRNKEILFVTCTSDLIRDLEVPSYNKRNCLEIIATPWGN